MHFCKTAAIVLVLCLGVVQTPDIFVWGAQTDRLTEISDPITPDVRREYNNIISSFATDMTDVSIKFHQGIGGLVFIRLEDPRFCISGSCVTIIMMKCWNTSCQYAVALVPPRYAIDSSISPLWGSFIHFPATQSTARTSIVVNNRFVAAYQGL